MTVDGLSVKLVSTGGVAVLLRFPLISISKPQPLPAAAQVSQEKLKDRLLSVPLDPFLTSRVIVLPARSAGIAAGTGALSLMAMGPVVYVVDDEKGPGPPGEDVFDTTSKDSSYFTGTPTIASKMWLEGTPFTTSKFELT